MFYILFCFLSLFSLAPTLLKPKVINNSPQITVADDWYKDDEIWRDLEQYTMVPTRKWANSPEEVIDIINYVKLSPNAKVLDLGCGPGRHSLEFARNGFNITGLDLSPTYIKKAKTLAKEQSLKTNFILRNMITYCKPNSYDCVVNLLSSIGYFTGNEDEKILSNVYRSLKKGGCLIVELVNLKKDHPKGTSDRIWIEHEGRFLLGETQVSEDGTWSLNKMIKLQGGLRKDYSYRLRLYSEHDLVPLLKTCKFRSIKTYGDFKGNPFTKDSEKLVIAAYK